MSAFYELAAPDYGSRGTQTLADFDPYAEQGWFANADRAMADGLYATVRGGAATVGLATGGLIRGAEALAGRDPVISDRWFDLFARPHVDALQRIDSDAASYGLASQVIHGLFRYGSEALLGGPAGVAALEFGPGAAVEVQKGKETATALKLAGTRAGTAALAVALPFTLPVKAGFGPAVLQRLAYGVGSNTVLGIASRAVEADVLKAAGYADEAPDVLDGRALAVDAILGAFFGLAGHVGARLRLKGAKPPPPELVDAAMTQNLKLRDEDSAPRQPRTPGEMLAHTERLNETLTELSDGAVQQKDGAWIPRDSVDTVDAMPVEPAPARSTEQQLADLEAQLEREAIQGEAEMPPEVAALQQLERDTPAELTIPDADGKPVNAREWLARERSEAVIASKPDSILAKIVDCALRSGEI